MPVFIALLRGINVGGHNILPMQDLKELLTSKGLQQVQTYIQSGNVVFRHPGKAVDLARVITQAVTERFGFAPPVLVLEAAQLKKALAGCPYPTGDPKALHFFFLESKAPRADLDRLQHLKTGREEFTLHGALFYLHAPEGIGRSKLAGQVEKCLGVPVTARNLRTVQKLLAMAEAAAA